MTTPGTSLRELFEERTASVPERPGRASEVAGRVTRLRRQRAAVTVAAALVAVGLALGLPLGLTGLARTDRAVPARQQTTDGLKVWAVGSKLVAHGSFRSDQQRSSTLAFTRTSGPLTFTSQCSTDLEQQLEIYLAVNGQNIGAGSCSPDGGGYITPGSFGSYDDVWSGTGVKVGERATVRFWVARTPSTGAGVVTGPPTYEGSMPDTTVSVGVYRRVDPATYPLPPRPKRLAVLSEPTPARGGAILETVDAITVAGGPNAPITVTRTLPARGLDYQLGLVSPGQVLVSVNGTAIGRYESWGYQEADALGISISEKAMSDAGVDVRTGEKVTITLTPSRFTDPGWVFYLLAGSGSEADLPATGSSVPATP